MSNHFPTGIGQIDKKMRARHRTSGMAYEFIPNCTYENTGGRDVAGTFGRGCIGAR